MLARKLIGILVTIVLITAGGLGTWWAHELRVDHEQSKLGRLHAVARTVAVAVESMLATGSLDDLSRMAGSLESAHDILGILITNRDGAPIVAPPPSVPEQVHEETRNGDAPRDLWLPELQVRARILPLHERTGGIVGHVAVVQDWSDVAEKHASSLLHVIVFTLVLAATIALCLGAVVQILVARPLRRVSAVIDTIGGAADRGAVHLALGRSDEIGRLAAALDQMQHRLTMARKALVREHEHKLGLERSLETAERFAAVGRLAAGVAHEIGTALNVVQGRAELLLENNAETGIHAEELHVIVTQCRRIAQTVRTLLDFSRRREPTLEPTELNEVVRSVLRSLAYRLTGFTVDANLDQELERAAARVLIDRAMVEQALLNVILNAIQAMGEGGRLCVSTYRAAPTETNTRQYVVEITDSGPGIAPQDLQRIFEPFFTTKPPGEGTGLGLAISYQAIAEQGGRIEAGSRPGEGACFRIYLPAADDDRGTEVFDAG